MLSEQTFLIDIEVTDTSVSLLQPATFGSDYQLSDTNGSSVVITFPPSAQRVPFSFVLLPDNLPEGDEGFLARSEGSQSSSAPTYLNPRVLAAESFIVITSTRPPIGEWKVVFVATYQALLYSDFFFFKVT